MYVYQGRSRFGTIEHLQQVDPYRTDTLHRDMFIITSNELTLEQRIERNEWPHVVPTAHGVDFYLQPADDFSEECCHFVLIVPPDTEFAGSIRIELLSYAEHMGEKLSEAYYKEAGHHVIINNGTSVCSVPATPHVHIYLFDDRDAKVKSLTERFVKASRELNF